MSDRLPDNDDQPAQPDKDLSKRRYGARKIPVTRALRDQVRSLLELQVSVRRISLLLDIPNKTVQRAIKRIDAQRIRQLQRSPGAELGRHHRLTWRFIEDSLAGQPTPAQALKAIQAMEWLSKIYKLDAPVERRSRRASRRS